MSAVADKLREARALIERGWGRGIQGVCKGTPCALKAVEIASGGCYSHAPELVGTLAKAIGTSADFAIAKWNDAPGRTQAEVLAAFDKAIALAEQEAVTL